MGCPARRADPTKASIHPLGQIVHRENHSRGGGGAFRPWPSVCVEARGGGFPERHSFICRYISSMSTNASPGAGPALTGRAAAGVLGLCFFFNFISRGIGDTYMV